MPAIVVKCPRFYSPEDEQHFFGWLTAIPGVSRVKGIGRDLHISVRAKLSDPSLRELLSLYKRYRLPMSALAVFCNKHNESWFKVQPSYWQRAVFGPAQSGA